MSVYTLVRTSKNDQIFGLNRWMRQTFLWHIFLLFHYLAAFFFSVLLRPSHTEGLTSGRPRMTKIVTDHQRPSATMSPPEMLQSHSFWSATSRPLVVWPVGDQLEWLAKICHRTVRDSRRWSSDGRRSISDRSAIGRCPTYDGRRISTDLLPTSRQYWRPVGNRSATSWRLVADCLVGGI